MQKYSVVILGLLTTALLPMIGEWGFSEACSTEIIGIGTDKLLMLPGLVLAWYGRFRQGDINVLGAKTN